MENLSTYSGEIMSKNMQIEAEYNHESALIMLTNDLRGYEELYNEFLHDVEVEDEYEEED